MTVGCSNIEEQKTTVGCSNIEEQKTTVGCSNTEEQNKWQLGFQIRRNRKYDALDV